MTMTSYSDTNLPSVAEMRRRWCFGLPLYDSSGIPMDDDDIQLAINSAISKMERYVGIYLKPMVICSNAVERGLVKGTDYEISEPAYDYRAKAFGNWGFLQLRERPARDLKSVQLVLPNGLTIIDFMTRPEWIKFYGKQGQLHKIGRAHV